MRILSHGAARMALPELEKHPLENYKAVPYPEDLTPDGIRAWIVAACKVLEISPTELARLADIAPSTVNKFLGEKGSKRGLTSRTIETLVRTASRHEGDKFGSRVRPLSSDSPGFSAPPIRVAASLKMQVFKASYAWDARDQFFVHVPIPDRFYRQPMMGFAVADDHAGNIYPFGSILIASKFQPETDPINQGEWFVVSRGDESGGIELTVRQVMVSPNDDLWLISMAADRSSMPDIYLGKQKLGEPLAGIESLRLAYAFEYKVFSAIIPIATSYNDMRFPD
jgi:hypothetical protein